MPTARTLGVEEELQIVDRDTFRLASRAPQLLSRLPDDGYAAELQRSTVETNTVVCDTLGELRADVLRLRGQVIAAADDQGLGVAAAGTTPLSSASDLELTARGRYSRMQQDYRLLVDEHLVCGLQVHVGVDDGDVAVRLMPRVESGLPVLLALSASSPFWDGQDTGYASVRTMIWQRWPTAGRTERLDSHADYEAMMQALVVSGVISDAKMAYFDVRPSSHVPTLELRVCDSCPLVDDVVLIAGLFRALVSQAAEAERVGTPVIRPPGALYRAAMWRAARSGLSDTLLDGGAEPVARPAAEVVGSLVNQLRPQLEDAGDWDAVSDLATAAVARGSSSERQRARFAERGQVTDVMQLLLEETSGLTPAPLTRTRWSSGYRGTSVDEALHPTGRPYATYRPVFEALEKLDVAEMSRRAQGARRRIVEQGLTFGVEGEQRSYPVDLLPRVIPAHEWAVLAAGLTQRARAIESFLRDAYGPADILRDGVMPPELLRSCDAWRPEAAKLPRHVVRAPIIGFDLVRDGIGGWRVLEDNVRVPSGVGYAIAVRRLMRAVMPELAVGVPMRDPEDTLALIGRTLRGCASLPDAEVALLSEGADNSGWYEHRLLAEEVGLLLAQPSEVEVRGGRVLVGGRRVDVLYLRIADELVDLVDAAGRRIGAQVLEVAQEGGVVVVNAPGNGIADDKAMYCFVPDMIAYYLGERPQLAPVPTYRCADPAECAPVLERLDELVTKPVGGYGGSGVLIGPEATRAELDDRRREILDHPAAFVAQETVALSTLPTLVDGHLEPRHVDLRAVVYLTGTGAGEAQLADLALTRVAPAGSMVVNSSKGGGAKDTWLLLDDEDRGDPRDHEGSPDVRTGR
jgi:carboxylate-amine ligase